MGRAEQSVCICKMRQLGRHRCPVSHPFGCSRPSAASCSSPGDLPQGQVQQGVAQGLQVVPRTRPLALQWKEGGANGWA